jgi:hypothetical protein
MRSLLPLGFCAIALWIGGNVLSSGAQITKANADRLAVAMCEVSQDCR